MYIWRDEISGGFRLCRRIRALESDRSDPGTYNAEPAALPPDRGTGPRPTALMYHFLASMKSLNLLKCGTIFLLLIGCLKSLVGHAARQVRLHRF